MSTALGESFKELIRLRYASSGLYIEPSEWITTNTYLKGKKYSFKNHEYQIDPVNDKHRIRAIQKCAQVGFTETFLRYAICFLVLHQGSQGIFTQPTANDMSNFAKSRVDTVFEECPVITKLGAGGVDSVQLKRIGSSFLNLRGTFGSRAAISVPSDMNIYDELCFSNPRVVSQYKSRLQHSEFKIEVNISTPTIVNYGVAALYNNSDQKKIMLKCSHCGHWQELLWPVNLFFRRDGKTIPYSQDAFEDFVRAEWEYSAFIGCTKCSREVDRSWAYREWVAMYPERARDLDTGVSGYYMSQLDAPFINAIDIIKASDPRTQGYKKVEDFYNFVLGLPYEGGDSVKITEAVRALATYRMELIPRASGTWIGLDLGNTCHLVVIKDFYLPDMPHLSIPVVIAKYAIDKDDLETRLPELINFWGALYVVSDAQPYTTTVEKIAKKFPNRMSVAYFGGKPAYALGKENLIVTINRTMMLDQVTEEMPKSQLRVASYLEDADTFWSHLKNLVKVKAEDDDGTEYFEYQKVGPDHYGYALGYALTARKIWYEVKPAGGLGVAPVGITGVKVTL